jgi:hypothetical protein
MIQERKKNNLSKKLKKVRKLSSEKGINQKMYLMFLPLN